MAQLVCTEFIVNAMSARIAISALPERWQRTGGELAENRQSTGRSDGQSGGGVKHYCIICCAFKCQRFVSQYLFIECVRLFGSVHESVLSSGK